MQSILPLPQQQLLASIDVQALLEEARQEVGTLARERWTDYNSHDPGITMLEQLTYAITDLGLRSGLDIGDYLAGGEANPFYTARTALPNAAYNPADYRRLLIDFKGRQNEPVSIHNAWIDFPSQTINFPSQAIKGLSSWWIDLNPASLGNSEIDLNARWLKANSITTNYVTYEPYFVFPAWEDVSGDLWEGNLRVIGVQIRADEPSPVENVEEQVVDQFYLNPVTLTFEGGMQVEVTLWICLAKGIPRNNEAAINYVKGALHLMLTSPDAISQFFQVHKDRVRLRSKQLMQTEQFIRRHRNLCEDFGAIGTIGLQQIGIQMGRLELRPEADAEKVLARIYFLLDQFLDPAVRPYTFEELRALDQTAADIFEGPLLENSFFPAAYLNPVERADKLYTSDIVRLIMQQPEVIGVDQLALDHYMDRIRTAKGVANCLHLVKPEECKPKLSIEDSSATVVKRNTPVVIDQSRVKTRYQELKNAFQAGFEYDNTGDLPIPHGETTDLATFYSIQNEFPKVYGLRAGEVPADASPLRKAQAKQLKAYLLFFEQLMLNYCGQLDHLQELFSIRPEVEYTYFYQPLYEVPAVQELFKDFLENDGAQYNDWEDFKNKCNAYIKTLDESTEDRATFLRRRNQFLDHLLARLGEDFSDYSAWVIAQNGGVIPQDLLFDKISFLQKVPELSSRRAVAFDYTATRRAANGEMIPDVWDTENVSGYEKRVAALLGIPDFRRRSLSQAFNMEGYLERYSGIIGQKYFRFWDKPETIPVPGPSSGSEISLLQPRRKILLASTVGYRDAAAFEQAIEQAKLYILQGRYYHLVSPPPRQGNACSYTFSLSGDNPQRLTLRCPDTFTTRIAAEKHISEIVHLFQGRGTEGMHVIEHVLLRPEPGVDFTQLDPITFQVKVNDTNYDLLPFIDDPYSFQISIFLPEWVPRFKDPEFRALVERTLRKELPAHVFAWIYWVKPLQRPDPKTGYIPLSFIKFEKAFKNWLSDRVSKRKDFVIAFNALVNSSDVERTNTYTPFDIPHNV